MARLSKKCTDPNTQAHKSERNSFHELCESRVPSGPPSFLSLSPPICLSPSPHTSMPHRSQSQVRLFWISNLNNTSPKSPFQHFSPAFSCTSRPFIWSLCSPTQPVFVCLQWGGETQTLSLRLDSEPKATGHGHPPTAHHREGTFPLCGVCVCVCAIFMPVSIKLLTGVCLCLFKGPIQHWSLDRCILDVFAYACICMYGMNLY